ncbi:MAG: flagellar biosynthesis protein FlhF [Methylibium sp.]|uniref:flagellar biosynthesis protein FlhF n=1 Tax=Methylibium sp. TaxID=2067992 RepID=UPI0017DDBB88|nr:flagellar biosynthesis protein FlhF [Methylibium sp.]MBA2722704.1 flagellar biosynthesis protein FlhF [Methylibium sp.]MBA3597639.1 flagellar biosynthesis protein FlhF [Methylibium sp.]
MNVQRFTGRTSRDAMQKMRQTLGDDAVVLSTKPCAEGIEMLAMAPQALAAMHQMAAAQQTPAVQQAPAALPAPVKQAARSQPAQPAPPVARPASAPDVANDAEQLAMSTLSFQDYVRERMLKKRDAALRAEAEQRAETQSTARAAAAVVAAAEPVEQRLARSVAPARREAIAEEAPHRATPSIAEHAQREPQHDAAMMSELRSMKGLIEERFGALAFMEKLQKQPEQARLTQKLLDCGFSPLLIRKLVVGMKGDIGDEQAWAAGVLERNLITGEDEAPLEDQGGVYALIGSTGVGKTTSTAKLAAAFATKHGASNLGLITLDAYRLGAHEQLRAYGRILGVPVHTAHDRTALEDLLELLSAKKMVLIDTAGVAQRDTRTRELLEMLGHRSIRKLLVVNAAVQGETIDDVMISYHAAACKGIVLSKLDEAVKLGPALDALIRHKLKVVAVANGQRVPEDWHRLSAQALVHRALRAGGSPAYRFDANDMNLVFAAPQPAARAQRPAAPAF